MSSGETLGAKAIEGLILRGINEVDSYREQPDVENASDEFLLGSKPKP